MLRLRSRWWMVDERDLQHRLRRRTELNVVDSYCYRIVAFPGERLKQLRTEDVERTPSPHLASSELSAFMERRDKLVAHFEQLISQKGEHSVLY